MTDTRTATEDLDALVERTPPIVDVDAHLVEPPAIWSSRPPARHRDAGPRVEMLAPERPILQRGGYLEAPGTEGDPVAWWHHEDHLYSVKRLIAAAGYPADEIDLRGITFDEMRPGCWQQPARLDDMSLNGVEAQLCYPNYPRFAGQIFLRGNDTELARFCDYPHQGGTYPHSRRAVAEQFGHLDDETIHEPARGNAVALLGLDLVP